jgi:hypothetical protein
MMGLIGGKVNYHRNSNSRKLGGSCIWGIGSGID